MVTHYGPVGDPSLPSFLRRAVCGRVMVRVAYDPKRDAVHRHSDGTPYGNGSSNLQHVTCKACRAVLP